MYTYIYIFIPFLWLCQVSAPAGRIFVAGQGLSNCSKDSMGDLSPQPGIKPQPLNWKADFSTTGPPGKSPQSPVLKAPNHFDWLSATAPKRLSHLLGRSEHLHLCPSNAFFSSLFNGTSDNWLACLRSHQAWRSQSKDCVVCILTTSPINTFAGTLRGFPCGSGGKESTHNVGDLSLIPGLGRSPGEGKGYPLQSSGLENFGLYSSWGHKESDTTEQLSLHWHFKTSISVQAKPLLFYLFLGRARRYMRSSFPNQD